jgi:hypothetical protein
MLFHSQKDTHMHQILSGQGKVYEDGHCIADAHYDLEVEAGDIIGQIIVVYGERDLFFNRKHPLTLRLDDGREVKFYIAKADTIHTTYQVQARGFVDG